MIDQEEMQRWSATFEEIAHHMMETDHAPWWMLVAEGGLKDRDQDTIIAVGKGDEGWAPAWAALMGAREMCDRDFEEDVRGLGTVTTTLVEQVNFRLVSPLKVMEALHDEEGMPYFLTRVMVPFERAAGQPLPFTVVGVRGRDRCQAFANFLGVERARPVQTESGGELNHLN